jgi:hypothetical protein
MCTLRVTRYGRTVGYLVYHPEDDGFEADPAVPPDVLSDIRVTYYRDNVLFGASGDGYAWREVRRRATRVSRS